jgi:charged multivesicular body protein 6
MNLFGRLLGKSSNDKKNDEDARKTLFNLKDTIETLTKRETFIEKNIQKMRQDAKLEIKNGNKSKALYFLKKIKMSQKEQEHIYGMIQNIELQVFTIERSLTTKDIVDTMKEAKNVISTINITMNTDEVCDIVDNIAEKIEDINEVGEILSKPFIKSEQTDDELLSELIDDVKDENCFELLKQQTNVFTINKNNSVLNELEKLPSAPKFKIDENIEFKNIENDLADVLKI